MLTVSDLCFRYRRRTILDRICLDVQPGEIVGILGPNGAGKSTLLKCVLRVLTADSGRISVDGKVLRGLAARERARLLAYVPQSTPGRFPMTVFDTVLMGRRPYLGWRPGTGDLEAVVTVLDRMDLGMLAARHFDCLSGGQKQKVMLARALAQQPRYLVLDEPTSSLDLRHQLEVMTLLRDTVRERRMGAVVAIHDLNLAWRFSDRIVLMQSGRVVTQGPPETVMRPDNIRRVFGVTVEQAVAPGGGAALYAVGPSDVPESNEMLADEGDNHPPAKVVRLSP